jgi:hypothetical protein
MALDALRSLIEQIKGDTPDTVTDEQIAEAVAGLAVNGDSSDEQIASVHEEIQDAVAAVRETRNRPSLKLLLGLRNAQQAATELQTTRAAAAAEMDAEAERLLAEFDAPAEQAEQEAPIGEAGEAPADEAPAEESSPELVAASAALADAVARGIERAFAAQTPRTAQAAPAGALQGRTGRPASTTPPTDAREVANAKVFLGSHTELGRPVASELEVARAIHDKYLGAYQASGSRGRMPVLTMTTEFPESRVLTSDSEANFGKIRDVTAPNALTAAGGLCAPLQVLYDIDVLGSTARPIRDALARFAVERGGIQFRPNTSAAAAVNGSGVWTMANDEAADDPETSTVKDCYVVDCPDLEEATVQAIYSCLEFSNITTRFDPESTAANVREGLIAHTRLAERELYKAMAANSKLVQANEQKVGAVRHILTEMDRLVAYYRDRHRLEANQPMTWMAPHWVRDMMRADLAMQMAAGDWQDALAVAENMVDGWFSRRNVSPVWFLDGAPSAATVNTVAIPAQVYADIAAGGDIPQFPTPFDSLLYPAGSFLFLDGGSLDLGLVRDSVLNTRNRYRMFSETFEGVAFRGIEALRPVFDVAPTGMSAGTIDTVTDAS